MSIAIFNIIPNVVKPNASYLPNTLTPYECNIVIGINDVGYGSTGETGFYNGFTPPANGWTIYYSDGAGNIYTQVANTFNDLLQITNYLNGTPNNFNNANAIVFYYGDTNQLGGTQILANYDLPNFVTNNLAMCLLSGYSMSFDENLYSIGFNYWIDLSNSNFFGIGGTFAIARSGAQTALVFDGSTTYGQVGYSGNNIIPIGNNDYTISVWFNPSNVGGVQGLVGWGDYGNTNEVNTLRLDGSEIMNSWSLNDLVTEGANITNGNWYNAVCTYVSAINTRSIYLNGSLIASDNPTGTHNVPNADNLTVGVTTNTEYFNGLIQNVAIYNSCLGASEILQNYQALEPIIN